jgi:RecA/RadA recombinase
MDRSSDVSAALATLQARWGAAAPRRGGELGLVVEGALARAPMPLEIPDEADAPEPPRRPGLSSVPPAPAPTGPSPIPAGPSPATRPRPGVAPDADGRIVSTGFAALDAILGMGGLPRSATVALRGEASSGKTTVALRVAAEAQAAGSIVAWLDLARAFDPVEAVSRGVRPEWLVVLTPVDLEEALALSAALLAARTVDLLVVDLPDGRDPAVAGRRIGDRLGRLAALARRAGTLLVVLQPDALGRGLAAAVEEASGLRLELRRSGWIRLGRDVVGQRSTVTIARNRYGPPGRRADLVILYAEGGVRDACLLRQDLLTGLPGVAGPAEPPAPPGSRPSAPPPLIDLKGPPPSADTHAPAPPALAAPASPSRPNTPRIPGERHLRLVAARPDRPRRTALDGRDGGRRGPAREGPRRAPGDPARERPPAGARGDLPGPRA